MGERIDWETMLKKLELPKPTEEEPDLCESCEHTLICVNEDPSWPTHECRYYLKRRPEARWEMAEDGDGVVCSNCRTDFCILVFKTEEFKFCPHCGSPIYKED